MSEELTVCPVAPLYVDIEQINLFADILITSTTYQDIADTTEIGLPAKSSQPSCDP